MYIDGILISHKSISNFFTGHAIKLSSYFHKKTSTQIPIIPQTINNQIVLPARKK